MNNKIYEVMKFCSNSLSKLDFDDGFDGWSFVRIVDKGNEPLCNKQGITAYCGSPESNSSSDRYYAYAYARRDILNLLYARSIDFSFFTTSTYYNESFTPPLDSWKQYWHVIIGGVSSSNYRVFINYDGVSVMYDDLTTEKIISYNAVGSVRGGNSVGVHLDFVKKLVEVTVDGVRYSGSYTKNLNKTNTVDNKKIEFYHQLATTGGYIQHVSYAPKVYTAFNSSSTLHAPQCIKVCY